MYGNKIRRTLADFVITAPRAARASRPRRAHLRSYSAPNGQSTKQAAPSSQGTGNLLKLVGVGTAAFLGYTGYIYATTPGNAGEVSSGGKVKAKARNLEDPTHQYVQARRSLSSPGVYLWGSNQGGVVDPDSRDAIVKSPRKLPYFDGQLLRDLKLDDRSAAAITEQGDLVQWGKGFSDTEPRPAKTLVGKGLVSLAMSADRVIALSSAGTIYSLPIAKADQEAGQKPSESSWMPFWSGKASLSYRLLNPALKLGEKVTALSGGQEHVLLLTNYGRVFSAASATEHYPSHGQLGIPGLTWTTRPPGPVDACHEVTNLQGVKATQVATGDYHSMVLADDGRVFTFGDNSYGQLGTEFDPAFPYSDTPAALPLDKLYRGLNLLPRVTKIAAGGANSFFTVDAKRILGPAEAASAVRDLGRVTADTWACGKGIWGALGNGKWTHLQDAPTKVKSLSGLFEFDERTNSLVPIRLRGLSVGTTHVSAVMDNSTHLDAALDQPPSRNASWGFDALWWGSNEFFQLGTGRRSNVAKPTYINAPAEPGCADRQEARLQLMPPHKGQAGNRSVTMQQRIECGRHVSAIYSSI